MSDEERLTLNEAQIATATGERRRRKARALRSRANEEAGQASACGRRNSTWSPPHGDRPRLTAPP